MAQTDTGETGQSPVDQISAGDYLTARLPSPANPFGSTQKGELEVTNVDGNLVHGNGTWDDDVVLDFSGESVEYQDVGKSGAVVEVRKHEPADNGGYWANKFDVVYAEEEEA